MFKAASRDTLCWGISLSFLPPATDRIRRVTTIVPWLSYSQSVDNGVDNYDAAWAAAAEGSMWTTAAKNYNKGTGKGTGPRRRNGVLSFNGKHLACGLLTTWRHTLLLLLLFVHRPAAPTSRSPPRSLCACKYLLSWAGEGVFASFGVVVFEQIKK